MLLKHCSVPNPHMDISISDRAFIHIRVFIRICLGLGPELVVLINRSGTAPIDFLEKAQGRVSHGLDQVLAYVLWMVFLLPTVASP